MKIRAALATLLLIPSVILMTPSAPAEAAAKPVTFPTVRVFNPSHYTYTLTIDDVGLDSLGTTLYAYEDGNEAQRVQLPSSGTVDWTFRHTSDYPDVITVERCGIDSTCDQIQTSPSLLLVRHITVSAPLGGRVFGPSRHPRLPLTFAPTGVVRKARVTWAVTTKSGHRLGAGTSTVRPNRYGSATLRVALKRGNLPPSLKLVATARYDGGQYIGTLTDKVTGRITFDDDFAFSARVAAARFFPVRDHYRDTDTVTFHSREPIRGLRVSVADKRGHLVRSSLRVRRSGATTVVRWDGKDNRHHVVRAGRYVVVARAHDPRGNAARIRVPVQVSRSHLVWKTWHTTVSPAKSLLNSVVGSCSSLRKLGGGGLGLYSQTSCRDDQQSVVLTVHGVYVPRGLGFRRLRVDVDGGAAAGAVHPYVVLGYIDAGNSFAYRKQFDGSHGVHHGATANASIVHDINTPRPFVVWELGLTGGSRYDVKRYAVSLQYRTLS